MIRYGLDIFSLHSIQSLLLLLVTTQIGIFQCKGNMRLKKLPLHSLFNPTSPDSRQRPWALGPQLIKKFHSSAADEHPSARQAPSSLATMDYTIIAILQPEQ